MVRHATYCRYDHYYIKYVHPIYWNHKLAIHLRCFLALEECSAQDDNYKYSESNL